MDIRISRKKFKCDDCGFVYNPDEGDLDNGIDPETEFEELPDDWECPMCGAPKAMFIEDDEE